ncbi:2,3-diaminopropionate biosynthesis protein SbnB [Herpetosiphon gulosus]|uniref:N-((2S)-2-amino-2-carboxyethyl)-L-glutamate dehydrogenase n=1 Tax=Herpetosiphon gulosus TaxID=1973496 RepID=A0ABP9X760_9CHLR
MQQSLTLLKGHEVGRILDGAELALIDLVQTAYEAHQAGLSALPHSSFLRFPNDPLNRIIALPAYLGGAQPSAGIKWIASFPGNLSYGIQRANATITLNDPQTGLPIAFMEGAQISAKRTAASAALAAKYLHSNPQETRVGLVGCGVINHETLRFLRAVFPSIREVVIFDTQPAHAEHFQAACSDQFGLNVQVAETIEAVLRRTSLIALATTAINPHIDDLSMCAAGTTILHTSLRDLNPRLIEFCDNVVDDREHVLRANTSLDLAQQALGHHNFVRCNLAEITNGQVAARPNPEQTTIFSPFGLGVLDLALAQWVLGQAQERNIGLTLNDFC